MHKFILLFMSSFFFISSCTAVKKINQMTNHPSYINQEFIYEIKDAPTPQCHASTIASSGSVLICAWFGGTEEIKM